VTTSDETQVSPESPFPPPFSQPLNNRSDEVAELEASLAPQVAQPLHKLMFHKDCAKHIDACEQIMAGVEEYRDEIVSNLDRVLHWLALRQNDGNTQCLLRVLDTVSALFSDLDANDTVLNDYEASIILPALAEKSGHNMDRVRQKYRELLAAAANISRHVKVGNHPTFTHTHA
jgi:cytoskeleton-associated protein 5